MPKCTVRFLPEGKEACVETGETLLAAAQAAGVYINSICGGDGICGKCRVVVREGPVRSQPTTFLNREEIRSGYVLACETTVLGNVTVEVPKESRLEGRPVIAGEDGERFGRTTPLREGARAYKSAPLSRKVFLPLPEPSLEDHVSDVDRVYREILRRFDIPVMQTGLFNLRGISQLVRKSRWQVTANLSRRGKTTEVVALEPGDTSSRNYGVAVDIGTTTVVAHLTDLNTLAILGTQAKYNSQIQYGEDVITRIIYASEHADGLATLTRCIVDDINGLVGALVETSGVALHDVTYVVCSGNTTMIHILMGLDTAHIRREPYIPAANSVPVVRAAEVGIAINPRGLLACLPGIASFVGSDVTAGVLASGMNQSGELSLFFDLGTNGEIAVGNSEWLMCCSASAGPAFEGGGIRCGMRAMEGAIERLAINDRGVPMYETIGRVKPKGICGSGLIDSVAEMVRVGYLDRSGALVDGACCVREDEDGLEFVLVPQERTQIGSDIVIAQSDVTNFIRSKGAIYLAAECLMGHVGKSFEDVDTVYISGGFGTYLDVRNAIAIGLMPDLPIEKFHFIGNGSAMGAEMCLLSQEALEEAEKIAGMMAYFELSTDPSFMNEFSSVLFLPHTDIDKFPSVVKNQAKGSSGSNRVC